MPSPFGDAPIDEGSKLARPKSKAYGPGEILALCLLYVLRMSDHVNDITPSSGTKASIKVTPIGQKASLPECTC